MKKFMQWRLRELPTGSDIARLVENKVITTQEARQILFTEVDDGDSNWVSTGTMPVVFKKD